MLAPSATTISHDGHEFEIGKRNKKSKRSQPRSNRSPGHNVTYSILFNRQAAKFSAGGPQGRTNIRHLIPVRGVAKQRDSTQAGIPP